MRWNAKTHRDEVVGSRWVRREVACSCVLRPQLVVRSAAACGLGGRLEHMTLEGVQSWRLDPTVWAAVRSWADGMPETLRGHAGWRLYGPVGTGKTGMAAALLHRARELGLGVLFVREVDVVTQLQATYNHDHDERALSEQRVLDRLMGAAVLALDDMGKAYVPGPSQSQREGMGWLASRLYTVIDERLTRGRPTIITTNLGEEALLRRVGEALADRLDTLGLVQFSGESRR